MACDAMGVPEWEKRPRKGEGEKGAKNTRLIDLRDFAVQEFHDRQQVDRRGKLRKGPGTHKGWVTPRRGGSFLSKGKRLRSHSRTGHKTIRG